MKKRFLEFGLLGVMFAAVIVGFATRRPLKKASAPTEYNFDYYPKANIYYNKTDNNYVFLGADGNWQVAHSIPVSTSLGQDKKVELKSATPNIWKDNERHRLIYAASLYASASDFKEESARIEPPPPPREVVSLEKKEKPEVKKERGIKGFFKKIFKKKKEKEDPQPPTS